MKKADRIAMMIHNTGDSVTEYRKGRERNFFVVRLGANTWGLEKSTSGCTCGVKYADTREEIEAYVAENGYKAVKTWARSETKDEPQQATPQPETPAAVQETANEPEAAQEQTEEAKARDLHARARELRERAEGLCEEGKIHENFVRSLQKVELQAYKAAAHESAVRLASKNPRVAAAMERLRVKRAANDEPEPETAKPSPEFNYDFLSGRYAIFGHADGVFSDEYETDDLKEAREYLKEEAEGTVKRGDYAIFDRDARQYIQIRATSKGRKAFKAENERLAAKAATPVSQTEPESKTVEAGQPAPQEAATPEDKINALFHELVPVEGKADTVAGEIVRAVCRIGYRYSNDGDYVGYGYGKETCNPAARYLMANAGENVAEIVRCLWAAGEECGILDGGSYGDWLSELVRAALVYLDEHPELETTPNVEDYWNYRNPNEDVDEWDDEDEDEWDAA